MLKHDVELRDRLAEFGASYRRYSDDILVIAPPGLLPIIEAIVSERLKAAGLTINAGKTERAYFRTSSESATGTVSTVDAEGGSKFVVPRPIAYLGFTFDGHAIRLRSSTVARYLIRMNRSVYRAFLATCAEKQFTIKRRQIYSKMSRLGPGTAYITAIPAAAASTTACSAPQHGSSARAETSRRPAPRDRAAPVPVPPAQTASTASRWGRTCA
jgi:RNA-directed DNA polymerase